MAFSHHYLLIIIALCILYVESADPSAQLCNENSNITTPELAKNIDSLLTRLVQATSQSGYGLAVFGTDHTRVFGLAECRADVSIQNCSTCIQTAAKEIQKMCPNRVDARVWYEYCLIRYNTKNFFGKVDTRYGTLYSNVENVTDPETFNVALKGLMNQTNTLAASPRSKGVGKRETRLSDSVTVYALSRCTRDLSSIACRKCLDIVIGMFWSGCENKKGCTVICSSCCVRYELYPFFLSA